MRRLPRRPRGAPPAGCVHPSRWKAPRCDGIFPLARWALRRRVGDRTRSLSINQLVARRQGPSRNRRLMPLGFDHAANRGLLVQLCDDRMGGRFAQIADMHGRLCNRVKSTLKRSLKTAAVDTYALLERCVAGTCPARPARPTLVQSPPANVGHSATASGRPRSMPDGSRGTQSLPALDRRSDGGTVRPHL
jgi:hypothetical protein